ncbi:hypothetical protein HPG69_007114 [Diceros bicornis minor]|uniref:Ubiquitin-like protease family profile domain-containing protein n=1 Tax=Diceros bicornis minor TaxID=77932 RepID=A0A7J7F3I9_DICBM|nr:hypothetical protein HPG69_007114 [Diceros bicornis minor]
MKVLRVLCHGSSGVKYAICECVLDLARFEFHSGFKNAYIFESSWLLFKEIPQQLNGSDCGMFTCKYADYISRDKPITFTQHQMPLFRKKMVWEILHQQLL